jgi:hypothetical protein
MITGIIIIIIIIIIISCRGQIMEPQIMQFFPASRYFHLRPNILLSTPFSNATYQ